MKKRSTSNLTPYQLSKGKEKPTDTRSYVLYNKDSTIDRIAFSLCEYLDDDAPLQWDRYRGVARFIATNDAVMHDLQKLRIALNADLMNELQALRNELVQREQNR